MRLFEKSNLAKQIAPLSSHLRKQGRLDYAAFGSPSFRWLLKFPKKIIRKLSRAIAEDGPDLMQAAELRTALVEDKERELFRFSPIDTLLHRTFTKWAEGVAQTHYSDSLHSYRKGKSWWTAIQPISDLLRAHRSAKPVKERGLYVLKRDIQAYTDSIPLGEKSPLWPMLKKILNLSDSEMIWAKRIIRPEVKSREGAHFTKLYGVPTGSTVSCLLFNIYLLELDQTLESIPGAHYARYGDDFVFIHESKSACENADKIIDRTLTRLHLNVHPEKKLDLYWTGSGVKCADANFKGTTNLEFLGMSIHFSGAIGLRKKRILRLQQDLKLRANAIRLRKIETPELRARAVCKSLAWAFAGGASPYAAGSAVSLVSAVTDRGQLKDLDQWIYRLVLRTVWGSDQRKVLRKNPPKSLRKIGLKSLVHARNQFGRAKT